jgi:hypothetical protein
VARCTKIISPNTEDAKYMINVKQIAKVYFKSQGILLECFHMDNPLGQFCFFFQRFLFSKIKS